MSRPITIVPFASTTLYPAGINAWNGQPTKLLNGAGYFTPGQAATATQVNGQINRTDATLASLTDHVGQIAAQNWRTSVAYGTLGGNGGDPATYDSFAHRWLMGQGYGGGSGTAGLLLQSVDGGATWAALAGGGAPVGSGGSPSGTIYSTAVRPSDGKIVIVTDGNAAFSTPYANFGTFSMGKAFWYAQASKWLIFGRDGSYAQVFLTSSDGSSSSSPTFPAGKMNLVGTTRYFAAASPSMVCVASNKVGTQTVVTSSDASAATWTAQTVGSLTLSEFIVGLEYSAAGVFVMALSNGTNSRVLTSPDGASWTEVANLTTIKLLSMAAQGAGLAAVCVFNGANRVITSKDQGVTWQFGAAGFSLATSVVSLACSGAQFLANSDANIQASYVCGAGT